MESGSTGRLVVPAWVWAVTAVAVVGILGAVLWVGSAVPPERVDTSDEPYLPLHGPPMGAGPQTPPAIPQPRVVSPPSRPAARVRITEASPNDQTKRTRRSAPPLPGMPPADTGVRDMFPMERVTKPAPPKASVQPTGEDFPGFSHDGRMWAFTGRFAASADVELGPTGADVGGRMVYALSGSGANHKVLFVQSRNNPRKYAIYRPAAG